MARERKNHGPISGRGAFVRLLAATRDGLTVADVAVGGTGPGDLEHMTGRAVVELTAFRVRHRLVTPRGCPV